VSVLKRIHTIPIIQAAATSERKGNQPLSISSSESKCLISVNEGCGGLALGIGTAPQEARPVARKKKRTIMEKVIGDAIRVLIKVWSQFGHSRMKKLSEIGGFFFKTIYLP
jgi:hypothetical protein